MNFSFAPPVDEQLQSPETLRQHSQDRSSLLASFNNEEPVAWKSNMAATDQNDSQSLPTLGETDVSSQMDISSPGEPTTVTHWSEEFSRFVTVPRVSFLGLGFSIHRLCNCCANDTYLSRCKPITKSLIQEGISKEEICILEIIPPSSYTRARLGFGSARLECHQWRHPPSSPWSPSPERTHRVFSAKGCSFETDVSNLVHVF